MRKLGVLLAIVILSALEPATAEVPAEPRFEVLVLGTYHAPAMFRSPDYTPAHIRATLELARPDVVGVESHPTWFAKGRYHVVTFEAEGVAVPWARRKGLPVHGIDWKDIEAWDRDVERRAIRAANDLKAAFAADGPRKAAFAADGPRKAAFAADGPLPAGRFGRFPRGVPAGVRAAAGKNGIDWAHINSEAYGKTRYRGQDPDDPDFAQLRDRGIAANIVEVMEAHPGKRMVVVIGAHHKPYLDILLRRRGDVRVLTIGKDVPFPDAKQLEEAWTSNDLVVSLGHLLDAGSGYFHAELVDLPRARRLLEKLEARKGSRDVIRYFRARIHVLEGDLDAADEDLDALLAARPESLLYPFPMREWRMRYSLSEAVRIEKARILMGRGRREEAETLLAPVARALDERLVGLARAEPPEKRRVEGVKDAGFERGSRATDYYAGWTSYVPMGAGKLRFSGDESIRSEGERSLRIEVVEPARYAHGHHVRQEVRLPPSPDLADPLRLGLSLRGEGVEWVRLEIVPGYSGRGAPLVSKPVTLETGKWTRAEVEFAPPSSLEFGFVVRFSGPAGARLWLDDATRLSLRYEAVPEEWTRLALARAFVDRVLAGAGPASPPAAAPAALPRPGLIDAGFETRELVGNPNDGWSCHAVKTGQIRSGFSTDHRTEGRRSLRLEVVRPASRGGHYLTQIVTLPASLGKGGTVVYSISLRADRACSGSITAGTWPDGRIFRTLASKEWTLESGAWSRQEVRVAVPAGARSVGLYVNLPNEPGLRLWIDDVRLE